MTNSRTKTDPSELDFDMLVYVASYIESHLQHFSPTSGEAGDYFGYTQANAVNKLNTLVRFGYLKRGTKRYARWTLTPAGKAWWLEHARSA